ncbi:MAG: metal ABC transporter substrate-binding protein [Chitinophagales bacterium]
MKKIIGVIIVLVVLFNVSGCGSHQTGNPQNEKRMVIVTSFYPLYIMTRNVTEGVTGVKVVNMTPQYTGCLHDYQITTRDMKILDEADVFIINGAGMESFLQDVAIRQPDLEIIEASKGLKLIKNSAGEINSHTWVDPIMAIEEVRNISTGLSRIDPIHESIYSTNANKYETKLEALSQEMKTCLEDAKNFSSITLHDAFPYLARDYGLNIVGVIEGEPGTEPGAGQTAELIEKAKKQKVRVIFIEPQYSDRAARAIASECEAGIYTLDPAVTGPDDPNAYIATMRKNLKGLKEALAANERD